MGLTLSEFLGASLVLFLAYAYWLGWWGVVLEAVENWLRKGK